MLGSPFFFFFFNSPTHEEIDAIYNTIVHLIENSIRDYSNLCLDAPQESPGHLHRGGAVGGVRTGDREQMSGDSTWRTHGDIRERVTTTIEVNT